MTPEERIALANEAERAMAKFLTPAFDFVIAAYVEKMMEVAAEQPWETDKIRKLAAGTKIARTVREQVMAIVRDGDAARADKRRADELTNMSDERRKWSIMGGGR